MTPTRNQSERNFVLAITGASGAIYALRLLQVLLAAGSGLVSLAFGTPFLTAHWLPGYLFGVPGLFDVGVYFVVFGTMTAIALALEDDGEEGP